MSNQNITTNLLVELSAEEQQLLSGGQYYHHPRRRRGGVRQKVENNPVFNPVINIYPAETQPYDSSSDQSPDSSSDQSPDSSSDQSPSRSRSYGNIYSR
jgi:hypothetical protein